MAVLSDLQAKTDLWYRIQVFLHDFSNMRSDVLAEKRLSATTHELYISAPYFTDAEAAQILSTLVEPSNVGEESTAPSPNLPPTISIEDAIYQRFGGFLDKRRTSGDPRPCGPHDMLPVYLDIFKLRKEDLKDEKFLGRLRRSGLGDFMTKGAGDTADARNGPLDMGKKGKKGKKGR
ncbi:MAG: hypothetical protein Q9168_006904 [Polycauliona sp. 1 TL-2023]